MRPFATGSLSESMAGALGGSRLVALRVVLLVALLTACGGPEADRSAEVPDVTSQPGATDPADAPMLERGDEAGLDFVHHHGGTGERYMMETMGSGLAVFDADGDGRQDVYFVQSGPVPWETAGSSSDGPLETGLDENRLDENRLDENRLDENRLDENRLDENRLFRNRLFKNQGDGTFVDITDVSGTGDRGYGMGACAGDVDGDGAIDLFVTNFGPDTLYRNRGDGTFEDLTASAGVGDARWSAGCAFADIDRDGDLDLYVVHYVDFSRANHRRCGSNGAPGYCHPDVYDGVEDSLYRNRGDGTFEDITAQAGLALADPRDAKGLGVVWIDADADGWPDAYVANDSTRNFLWRNRGDGTFEDIATLAGTAFNARGQTEAGMGVATADVDGDAVEDLYVSHLDAETNTLYRGGEGGLYRDATDAAGLGGPSLPFVGFGVVFFDLELDGDPDLFVANGHIIDNVSVENPELTYEQRDQLYRNEGDGRFTEISSRAGPYFAERHVGRGVAAADFDDDGDTDLVISNSDGPAVLLWNRAGDRARPLCLDLRLPSGAPAVGARAVVEGLGGERAIQTRTVRAGGSYLSQHDPRLCFGSGVEQEVDRARDRGIDPASAAVLEGEAPPTASPRATIHWPNGATSTHDDLALGVYQRLTQP